MAIHTAVTSGVNVDYILVSSKYSATGTAYLESINFDTTCLSYDTDGITCLQYRYDTRSTLSTVMGANAYIWVESLVIDESNDRVYASVASRKADWTTTETTTTSTTDPHTGVVTTSSSTTTVNNVPTYKGNFMLRCDLALTACTFVASEKILSTFDYSPLSLSWYSGDRVMGLGTKLQDGVIQSGDLIYVWIEKTAAANDHYYAWEIQL